MMPATHKTLFLALTALVDALARNPNDAALNARHAKIVSEVQALPGSPDLPLIRARLAEIEVEMLNPANNSRAMELIRTHGHLEGLLEEMTRWSYSEKPAR